MSLFYKNHPNKPIATFEAIDTALIITKPIIKPVAKPMVRPIALKQKQGQLLGKNTNKQAKKN